MSRIPASTCGWELDDIGELGTQNTSTSTLAVVSSSPSPASGGYCLKAANGGTSGSNHAYLRCTLGSSITEAWFRFKFYPHVAGTENAMGFFEVLDATNAVQVSFTWDPTDNLLRAYRGSPATNLLGTTSAAITQDQWNLIDLHITISAAAGVVEIWIGGNQRLNLTSQNTRASSNTEMTNYDIGQIKYQNDSSGSTSTFLAFDDLAINNTSGGANNGRIGDGRVLYLPPNGAGSNTAQTIGGSVPAATNYQSVNEIPPDDGVTFVYSSTPGTRDTYALADLPAGASSVNCVEVIARCQNSDAGAGQIGLTVKSGSTTNEATAQSLDTVWRYYRALYETDPHTLSPWTPTNVNAMECGTTTE